MPAEKSDKRGRGRPLGVKDRKQRRFKPRLVVPMEQQVLSKREAAAVAGVGLSKIDQNLSAIGAVRSGSRILIFRDQLMAWVHSLPPAVSDRVWHQNLEHDNELGAMMGPPTKMARR